MSALELRKLKANHSGLPICNNPDCWHKGRVSISILGHPVRPASPHSLEPRATLCPPCAKEAQAIWDEMSGKAAAEAVTAAITALGGTRTERIEAIFTLREHGVSNEDAARALRQVAEGWSVADVIAGLDEPVLAVAA